MSTIDKPTRILSTFGREKEELSAFLTSFRQGEGKLAEMGDRFDYFSQRERFWKRYPALYRNVEGMFEQLKDLHEQYAGKKMPANAREAKIEKKEGGNETLSQKDTIGRRIAAHTKTGVALEIIVGKNDVQKRENEIKGDEAGENREEKNIGEAKSKDDISEMVLYTPTQKDIDIFYDAQGVIGERAMRTLLLFGALAKACMGIESLSGSGKTTLINALLNALPQEKVYTLQQASEKALFYDYEEVNAHDFVVITELQNMAKNQPIRDAIKSVTDGQATYKRTNPAQNGIDRFLIKGGKSLIYTLAIENDYHKLKDLELSRRFIVFGTDIRREHTKKVIETYAQQKMKNEKNEYTNLPRFTRHVAQCLSSGKQVIDPFFLAVTHGLPGELSGNAKTISNLKYYEKLVSGATLFYHHERPAHGRLLFATLEDVATVLGFYGTVLYDNIMGLSVVDRLIVGAMEKDVAYTDTAIFDRLDEEICERSEIIYDSLDNLIDLRFVKKEKVANQKKEGVTRYKKVRDTGMLQIDWNAALEQADKVMCAYHPEIRDQWYAQCIKQRENKTKL